MKNSFHLLLAGLIASLALTLVGCKEKSPLEKAADGVEKAADATADAAKDAVKKVEDAVKK